MYQYNVRTLTMEQLRDMIASGDDSKRSQIRIKEDGTIFLSAEVGNSCLDGIAGRFETFDAYNNYIGQKAAENQDYIKSLYLTICHWIQHPIPYIDRWIQA